MEDRILQVCNNHVVGIMFTTKRFKRGRRSLLLVSKKQKVLRLMKKKRLERKRKRKSPVKDTEATTHLDHAQVHTEGGMGLDLSSPSRLFETLIDPMPPDTFFTKYWEKQPLILKRNGSHSIGYSSLFSLGDLQKLVMERTIMFGTHVNVCRYVNHKRQSLNRREGRLSPKRLAELWEEKKATFQFHQPQQFKDILWKTLTHLESYFACLVGSNVYITPAGSQGLAPHYDDVEVFILQLEGCKHWRLYPPPTQLPLTCSHDLSQMEIGQPTHDFVLEAGDLLYFPRGTVHQADTPPHTPHSTHITISTYQNNTWGSLTAHSVELSLQQAMATEVAYRRGLPCNILGLPSGRFSRDEDMREKLLLEYSRVLVGDLVKHLDMTKSLESYSRDFIKSRLPPYSETGEVGPQGPMPVIGSCVSLSWPDYTYMSVRSEDGDDWVIIHHSLTNRRESHMTTVTAMEGSLEPVGVKFPVRYRPALAVLFSNCNESIPAASLPLSKEDTQNLLMTLWAEGLLQCKN